MIHWNRGCKDQNNQIWLIGNNCILRTDLMLDNRAFDSKLIVKFTKTQSLLRLTMQTYHDDTSSLSFLLLKDKSLTLRSTAKLIIHPWFLPEAEGYRYRFISVHETHNRCSLCDELKWLHSGQIKKNTKEWVDALLSLMFCGTFHIDFRMPPRDKIKRWYKTVTFLGNKTGIVL